MFVMPIDTPARRRRTKRNALPGIGRLNNALAAASCVRATLFGKINDLRFPPLHRHMAI